MHTYCEVIYSIYIYMYCEVICSLTAVRSRDLENVTSRRIAVREYWVHRHHGGHTRVALNCLDTMVMGCSEGLPRVVSMMPRDASLPDSCTSDHCNFSCLRRLYFYMYTYIYIYYWEIFHVLIKCFCILNIKTWKISL